jgi:hypothetical protein
MINQQQGSFRHDKRMKALQNNVSRRGLSLAPCGRGQGEGYAFVEASFSCVCRGVSAVAVH